MYKKLIYLSCLALMTGMTSDAAANVYDEGGDPNNSDHLWMTAENWTQGLPNINNDDGSQWADMSINDTLCIIQDGDDASAKGVHPGAYGAENTLEMTGGTLTCDFFNVGRGGNGAGYGDGSFGHFIMSGGLLTALHVVVPNQWDAPPYVQGDVLMTGGEIITDNLVIGKNAGVGHFDFHGGTIHCASFIINLENEATVAISGTMDVTEGVLTSDNNLVDQIQGYIDEGWITFYGATPLDARYYVLDYDITNPQQTTLAAVHPSTIVFENPWGPTPINGAILDITDGNVTLGWQSGDPVGAYKHEVYFGTTETPGFVIQLNESDTDHVVTADQLDTTYYWKIIEVEGANTYEGPLWRFSTVDFLTVDDFDLNNDLAAWTDTGSVVTSSINDDMTMRINCLLGQCGSTYRTPPQSDWDQQDLKAVRLSFFGDPANAPDAELSITVNSTTVAYDDTEGLLQTAEWTQWFIPYATLTGLGVDLNNVTMFQINVCSGSAELQLDIENIELALLQCLENPVGDASGDCVVNILDLAPLSNEWMVSGYELP